MLGYEALTVRLVALVFGSLVAAALAHEWTHIAVAKALGARVRVLQRDLVVIPTLIEWQIPASKPRVYDYLINFSPFFIAASIAGGYYATQGVPSVTLESGMACLALAVYGQVSPDDLAGVTEASVLPEDIPGYERVAAAALAVFAAGVYLMCGAPLVEQPARANPALSAVGLSFMLAGGCAFALGLHDYARAHGGAGSERGRGSPP